MAMLEAYRAQLLSGLRIMTGLLLLQHGTTKFLNFPVSKMNDVPALSMGGVAGMFELVGGAMIVLGLFTRPVAFVLSGLMAVAYFYAHAARDLFPLLNGGELAVLYCFVFLYLSASGGGTWSLDKLRSKAG